MASEIPSKRQKLEHPTDSGDANDSEDAIDTEVKKALDAIENIQNEIDGLNEKASEEILAVEQKYNKLKKVHFDKRNAIIDSIPNFWVTSLLNHPQIATVVNPKEEECLQYLSKVEVEEFEDIKSGYKLTFNFKANPFFTNEVLCKEYHLHAQTGDPESKSTTIDWKDGMDLTKLPKTTTAGKGRWRQSLPHSFFSWFVDKADPEGDGLEEMIKDDMWPNPLRYYLESERDITSENGYSDDDDEEDDEDDDLDESVVVVDDDDDDEDEEVYEVEDDDDELDTTGDVEVIEEEEVGVEELEDDENEECAEEISNGKDKDEEEEDSVSKDADENKEETGPV